MVRAKALFAPPPEEKKITISPSLTLSLPPFGGIIFFSLSPFQGIFKGEAFKGGRVGKKTSSKN
jgi:hypothetical protein